MEGMLLIIGAHLLLFFMAFVFGSFCTFCFHMLMYLFDEKCVLFPKLQSIATLKNTVIQEILPYEKDTVDRFTPFDEAFVDEHPLRPEIINHIALHGYVITDKPRSEVFSRLMNAPGLCRKNMLPVDFLSSQWVEKSMCYLPTYVPLLSGIFGLVWTTMFLMCSTGSRTLTGLQRPWRVLPPVFIFSLAMGSLSVYSSAVTDYGLHELCLKLGEITGSTTCSYTVNVLTLAYERRIRGVYQAIRLTITAAWLHTFCWLLSAVLALARVALAVDFQLVRVNVELIGDIDKILERHETQIRTVSPDVWYNEENTSQTSLPTHVASKVHFTEANTLTTDEDLEQLYYNKDLLFMSKVAQHKSGVSLVPSESHKLARLAAYENLPTEQHFIVKIIYDLLQSIDLPESESESITSELDDSQDSQPTSNIIRQVAKERISRPDSFESIITIKHSNSEKSIERETAEETATAKTKYLQNLLNEHITRALVLASTSKINPVHADESTLNITEEMRRIIERKENQDQSTSDTEKTYDEKSVKKSNLKHVSVQTEKRRKRSRPPKVQIAEEADVAESTAATGTTLDADKETQTNEKKEKQD